MAEVFPMKKNHKSFGLKSPLDGQYVIMLLIQTLVFYEDLLSSNHHEKVYAANIAFPLA